MDLDEMFGEGWCITLASRPLTETLRRMGVAAPVPCPGGLGGLARAADFLQERQGEGPFTFGRALPGDWTLVFEGEGRPGCDDEVLRALAAGGRTALCAYRDPDTRTATIGHDGAVLGRLDLSGGHFDGPSGSVDPAHPVVRPLVAAGFSASDDCEPTGEAVTEEPDGCLVLAVRVLTGIPLTATDFETAGWTGGVNSREE